MGMGAGGGDGFQSNINVTPMVDIMLVLLIIFMITTPLLQSGVTVNLPKAKNPLDAPDADSKDAVIVALTREGRVYLAKSPISEDELMTILTERFTGEMNKTMYLKADQAVAYGRVVQIVNQCRKAGVEKIGLMAEKEKQ
jgi:biopolymer transport protein TolR